MSGSGCQLLYGHVNVVLQLTHLPSISETYAAHGRTLAECFYMTNVEITDRQGTRQTRRRSNTDTVGQMLTFQLTITEWRLRYKDLIARQRRVQPRDSELNTEFDSDYYCSSGSNSTHV